MKVHEIMNPDKKKEKPVICSDFPLKTKADTKCFYDKKEINNIIQVLP